MVSVRDQTFYNNAIDRTTIKRLIGKLVGFAGHVCTASILDQLKHLGFEYATRTGISLGIDDLLVCYSKTALVQDAERQVRISEKNYKIGSVHAIEKLRQIVEIWYTTSEFLKREMSFSFNIIEPFNPVHMMSFSGARGSKSQVHQLVGMRGLMSDPEGRIIDLPIKSNLREGLSITEYIISCYGARKGVVDTAIRTAEAGYLTRRLVETAQYLVIRHIDCGTFRGILLHSIQNNQGYRYISCQKRLLGRVLSRSMYNGRRCIGIRNQDIGIDLAKRLILFHQEQIQIRSALTCKSTTRICQLCYGWNSNYGKLVQIGEAVGVIAGQSIGEPGTQLTLRTFHTGGVFTGAVANQIRTPFNGILCFEESMCQLIRSRHGTLAWKCLYNLLITIKGRTKEHVFHLPFNSLLFVANNQYVESKQIIAEIRSTQISLKERVQKDIYSNFEGTVFYKQTVSSVRRSREPHVRLTNNNLTVNNTGHIWVLSGRLSKLSQKKTCNLFQIQDYVEFGLPLAKLDVIPKKDYVSKLPTKSSILYSNKLCHFNFKKDKKKTLFVKNLKSDFSGIFSISNCVSAKDPNMLCFLTLSSIDQFQMYVYDKYKTFKEIKPFGLSSKSICKSNETLFADFQWYHEKKCKPITKTLHFIILNINYLYNQARKSVFFGYQQNTLFLATIVLVHNNTVFKAVPNSQIWLRWYLNDEKNRIHILNYSDFSQYIQFLNIVICMLIQSYRIPKLGTLISQGKHLKNKTILAESGKVVMLQKSILIFRLAQCHLTVAGTKLYACCNEGIYEQEAFMTLIYEQLRASDIVQGLPKAEQLLEARSTNELMFELQDNFQNWMNCLSTISQPYLLSADRSVNTIQIDLVNRIQTVYLSQGISISDKHVEIIVHQMTSKVLFIENIYHVKYNPVILPGELLELSRAKRINSVFKIFLPYRPMLLGITKASLNMEGFLLAASFQRTTKVLTISAFQGKIDWIKGLQENVMFGGIISAGTGCKEIALTIKPNVLSLQRNKRNIVLNTFTTRLLSFPFEFDVYEKRLVSSLTINKTKKIEKQIVLTIDEINSYYSKLKHSINIFKIKT